MIAHATFTALHALGFMTLFSVLVAQHLSARDTPSGERFSRLKHLQWIYLGAWVLLLLTGGIMASILMPIQIYLQNGLFHLKLTLFLVLLPLWFFFGWQVRRTGPDHPLPSPAIWTLRIQLLTTATIPFLATFMARGYGYFGSS